MPNFERIYPYFYPTTVVVVDDDPEFLDSFLFRYRRHVLCRAFREPERAIHHIRQATPEVSRHLQCLEPYPDAPGYEGWSAGDQSLTFRPAAIGKVVYDARRFAEVSVAIIDYDMPGLDGIEVCRRLRGLPVKRLMLTGKVDEKLATAAFNDGLIDHFLIKQEVDLTRRLERAIAQLQSAYFERGRVLLESILGLQESAFLLDPAFGRFLADVLTREEAVEYYLSDLPPGVVMLKADGKVHLVLVQDEAALQLHEEAIRDGKAAPRELLARVMRRDGQPWFPTPLGLYEAHCAAWEGALYPAERVGNWYCSVIRDEGGWLGSSRPVVSYESYRRGSVAFDA